MISTGFYVSPLGAIRITFEEDTLLTLDFCQEAGTGHIPEAAKRWLDCYFAGQNPGPIPPVRLPQPSPFRTQVWELLLDIPYGEVVTYGALAQRMAELGFGKCAQAVGGAVGSNPISLMVPCHRVVGAGGKLTGYAWGLDRKKALLALEQGEIPYKMEKRSNP